MTVKTIVVQLQTDDPFDRETADLVSALAAGYLEIDEAMALDPITFVRLPDTHCRVISRGEPCPMCRRT